MTMEYIRKTYGVPAKRGGRVRFISDLMTFDGTIIGSRNAYLRVRLDDGHPKDIMTLHPTWRIEYLPDEAQP